MATVKNQSKGYGYTYSNLADLEKAGVTIPKMRTKATEFGEYVEYLDAKTNEWQQGAKVVLIESKQMNAAQAYGAALTYARRYTVQLAESVACADDDEIEKAKPTGNGGKQTERQGLDFEYVKSQLEAIKTIGGVNAFAKDINDKHPRLTEKQKTILGRMFQDRREDLEESEE